jgi:hypothetical protein
MRNMQEKLGNLGKHLSICFKTEENQESLCRDGRSHTDFWPAVRQTTECANYNIIKNRKYFSIHYPPIYRRALPCEGSQASPLCPSGKSSVKVSEYGVLVELY